MSARESSVVERLLARPAARIAAIVLWSLCGLAVLAPFVASDVPWYVRAADRAEVESALRTLVPLAKSCDRLARIDDAQWATERLQGSTATRAETIERDRAAIALRARIVRESIVGSEAAVLPLEAALEGGGWLEGVALACAEQAKLRDDGTTASGGRLVARGRWPLLAGVDALTVLFLSLWIVLGGLGARVIARKRTRRRARRLVLLAPLALALVWPIVRPDDARLDARAWKERLASSSMQVNRAVFAPIPWGYAESNASESWRPPTWLSDSEVDAEGRYVRGARAETTPGVPFPPPMSIVERPGEPGRNAWSRHVLGTDGSGRDVLARVLHGARASLAVGLGAALLLAVIGTLAGVVAGGLRGWADVAVSRVLEVVVCFPAFFLVLAFAAAADPRVIPPALSIALVIGFVGWTGVARLVRARALELAEAPFVLAARAQGLSTARVLFVHVLPNAATPALVALSFGMGSAILTESALSFLGLGVQVPVPSWGALAAESRNVEYAWILIAPGLCVFASALAANVLGEALRDVLDPRREAAR